MPASSDAELPASSDAEHVTVGRIGPPRGVHGELFVQPFTDAPDDRFAAGATLATVPADRGPLRVTSAGYSGAKFVVRFDGVDTREDAQALRGTELRVPVAARPPLDDPDEYYDTDLIGLSAVHVDGSRLGPVTDVVHAGGATYLVVAVDGRDRLVPFVRAIVPVVDQPAGLVRIDPPEGLFEL